MSRQYSYGFTKKTLGELWRGAVFSFYADEDSNFYHVDHIGGGSVDYTNVSTDMTWTSNNLDKVVYIRNHRTKKY